MIELENMMLKELRKIAKDMGLIGYSYVQKSFLIYMIKNNKSWTKGEYKDNEVKKELIENASESETEYEYSDYGITTSYIVKIMVAGGGLGNGNAYADIECHYKTEEDYNNDPCEANEIYYCEYGNNPRRDLLPGNTIVYGEEGFSFNIE